ncbi:MAG: hypothetical protein MUP98_06590 [Candidatus Aminicenantes bacterium]|nr:hypothetical protein [Candidatus Aminicenantes bacterium]
MSTHKIRESFSQLILDFLMADYLSWKILMRFADPEQRVITGKKPARAVTESAKRHLLKKK